MSFARDTFTGDGATTNFSITFPYILKAHVLVYIDGTLKTLTTHYTWFNATTIQFVTAPALNAVILIKRSSSQSTKLVDFQDASTLTEASLDRANDQMFYMAQEAVDQANLGIVLDTDDRWNANSKIIKNVADPTAAQHAATKAYGDANWGGASATAAAASAAAAAASETAAGVSATAAAASYDSFDDRYLGAKAANPTLDNDGNALIDGALYFNTASNDMRVYDLGTTTWITFSEYVPKSLVDAKGDIVIGTAADTPGRLAVGSNGTIPMANSSASAGLSYASMQVGKNAVINGAFDVWQRGTSFAAMANATYMADRFAYTKAGSMAHTGARSTDVPTFAQAGVVAQYSLHIDCTTASTPLGASDICGIFHVIEGYNWRKFWQRAITLSFWVKATKTGTYCVSLRSGAIDRTYVAEYTVSAADTWEKKTINIPASPSGGTWNIDNTAGAYLTWSLGGGSTDQMTANTWLSASGSSTANQVNACDDVANNFRLALVQFEVGDVATDFEILDYAVELLRCQRYYARIAGNTSCVGSGVVASATTGRVCIPLGCPLRTPTPTTGFGGGVNVYDGGVNPAVTAINATYGAAGASLMLDWTAGGGGLTGGNGMVMNVGAATTDYVEIIAEL